MQRRIGLGLIGVLVFGALLGVWAQHARAPKRWSDVATWNGTMPRERSDVEIPAGQTVLLDLSPPPLRHLVIDGTLIVADRDVALQADSVTVHGRFEIGNEFSPFRHHAVVTLTGHEKMLGVVGGTLELHGQERGPSWTHLGETGQAGTDKIVLAEALPWKIGDHIVIASTDFDAHQAEERIVRDVHGRTVTLDTPLQFTHWGQVADGVDERAEVGLLSRNVVIQGAPDAESDGQGGQVMMMRGGTAHISGVELTRMGREGKIASYPIHFHRLGNAPDAYVMQCSLHHCYNRCITVHGTNGVRIIDNVCYDTIGHCYFLEDGNETGNTFADNLGVLTRRAPPDKAILPSDLTPATFWITNPDNIVTGNVAAGSDQYGFWYSLPEHPTGLAKYDRDSLTIHPRRIPLGVFRGNVAHSNEHDGLFVDNGPNPPGVYTTPNYEPRRVAVFDNFTSYKNRRRGLWLRGHDLIVRGARVADNSIGVTLAASESFLTDSLIVGETDNLGTPAPGDATGSNGRSLPKPFEARFPIRGFEFYDGLVGAQRVTFRHFQPTDRREASALSYLRYTPFFIDPRNAVSRLTFDDANPVYLEHLGPPGDPAQSGDGYRSAVFVDTDGSVTGKAGQTVVANNRLLENDRCSLHPEWNAAACDNPYGRLFIDNRDPVPNSVGPVAIRRDDPSRPVERMWGVPSDGPATSFQTTIIANQNYVVRFHGAMPHHVRLALRFRETGDWARVVLPCQAHEVTVTRDHRDHTPLPLAASQEAFDQSNGDFYYRSGKRLYVKMVVPPHGRGTAVVDIQTT